MRYFSISAPCSAVTPAGDTHWMLSPKAVNQPYPAVGRRLSYKYILLPSPKGTGNRLSFPVKWYKPVRIPRKFVDMAPINE